MARQELRPWLQSHRSWLSGLWTSSSNSASFESRKEQALLLSELLSSLLKCCNPEVKRYCFAYLCMQGLPCLHVSSYISSQLA
jgi:hypothetical protein